MRLSFRRVRPDLTQGGQFSTGASGSIPNHVALNAVDDWAVFDDLPRAFLARGEYHALRGQPGHVVMPVPDIKVDAHSWRNERLRASPR